MAGTIKVADGGYLFNSKQFEYSMARCWELQMALWLG